MPNVLSVDDAISRLTAEPTSESEGEKAVAENQEDVTTELEETEGEVVEESQGLDVEEGEASEEVPEATEELDEEETEENLEEEASEPVDIWAQEIEVTFDGKPQKMTVREAANGHLRQADYSRNMNALQQLRQELTTQRDQYVDVISKIENDAEGQLTPELLETDPVEYTRLKERRDLFKQEREEREKEKQQEAVDAAEQRRIEANKAVRSPAFIPEWSDEKLFIRETEAMTAHFAELGYSDRDLYAVSQDPRAMRDLRKAWLYDEMRKNQASISSKKVRKTRKSVKGGAPIKQSRQNSAKREIEEAHERLRKAPPGRGVDAATALLLAKQRARSSQT